MSQTMGFPQGHKEAPLAQPYSALWHFPHLEQSHDLPIPQKGCPSPINGIKNYGWTEKPLADAGSEVVAAAGPALAVQPGLRQNLLGRNCRRTRWKHRVWKLEVAATSPSSGWSHWNAVHLLSPENWWCSTISVRRCPSTSPGDYLWWKWQSSIGVPAMYTRSTFHPQLPAPVPQNDELCVFPPWNRSCLVERQRGDPRLCTGLSREVCGVRSARASPAAFHSLRMHSLITMDNCDARITSVVAIWTESTSPFMAWNVWNSIALVKS